MLKAEAAEEAAARREGRAEEIATLSVSYKRSPRSSRVTSNFWMSVDWTTAA